VLSSCHISKTFDDVVAIGGIGDRQNKRFVKNDHRAHANVSLFAVGMSLAEGVASSRAQPIVFTGAR